MDDVTLTCWSNEQHLSQVYTGLAMLHRRGAITLRQNIIQAPPPDRQARPHLVNVRNWHCRIETEGRRYYIDTHDGDELCPDGLGHIYLKRSKLPDVVGVRALGLNYEVLADGFDRFEFERRLKMVGPTWAAKYVVRHRPMTVSQLQGPSVAVTDQPAVLFQCRAWELNHPDRAKNEERAIINQSRAETIMALRKAFGDRCIAGFSPTDYALRYHGRAVLQNDLSEKSEYLKLVRSIPICVASTGLHGSIGWKLGEYVAHGRAIVSEPLNHDVPFFRKGTHYLEFSTPQQCVDAVGTLMEDPSLCADIGSTNFGYYHRYLRPDWLMATALNIPNRVNTPIAEIPHQRVTLG